MFDPTLSTLLHVRQLQDLRQYLVLDDATETEEAEEVIKQMHAACEGGSSDESESDSDSSNSSSSTVQVAHVVCCFLL